MKGDRCDTVCDGSVVIAGTVPPCSTFIQCLCGLFNIECFVVCKTLIRKDQNPTRLKIPFSCQWEPQRSVLGVDPSIWASFRFESVSVLGVDPGQFSMWISVSFQRGSRSAFSVNAGQSLVWFSVSFCCESRSVFGVGPNQFSVRISVSFRC